MGNGFKPTLAIVFLSYKQDRVAICDLLNQQNITIFGATTAGEFTDENLELGSTVILLMDLNPSYFKIVLCGIENHLHQSLSEGTKKRLGSRLKILKRYQRSFELLRLTLKHSQCLN